MHWDEFKNKRVYQVIEALKKVSRKADVSIDVNQSVIRFQSFGHGADYIDRGALAVINVGDNNSQGGTPLFRSDVYRRTIGKGLLHLSLDLSKTDDSIYYDLVRGISRWSQGARLSTYFLRHLIKQETGWVIDPRALYLFTEWKKEGYFYKDSVTSAFPSMPEPIRDYIFEFINKLTVQQLNEISEVSQEIKAYQYSYETLNMDRATQQALLSVIKEFSLMDSSGSAADFESWLSGTVQRAVVSDPLVDKAALAAIVRGLYGAISGLASNQRDPAEINRKLRSDLGEYFTISDYKYPQKALKYLLIKWFTIYLIYHLKNREGLGSPFYTSRRFDDASDTLIPFANAIEPGLAIELKDLGEAIHAHEEGAQSDEELDDSERLVKDSIRSIQKDYLSPNGIHLEPYFNYQPMKNKILAERWGVIFNPHFMISSPDRVLSYQGDFGVGCSFSTELELDLRDPALRRSSHDIGGYGISSGAIVYGRAISAFAKEMVQFTEKANKNPENYKNIPYTVLCQYLKQSIGKIDFETWIGSHFLSFALIHEQAHMALDLKHIKTLSPQWYLLYTVAQEEFFANAATLMSAPSKEAQLLILISLMKTARNYFMDIHENTLLEDHAGEASKEEYYFETLRIFDTVLGYGDQNIFRSVKSLEQFDARLNANLEKFKSLDRQVVTDNLAKYIIKTYHIDPRDLVLEQDKASYPLKGIFEKKSGGARLAGEGGSLEMRLDLITRQRLRENVKFILEDLAQKINTAAGTTFTPQDVLGWLIRQPVLDLGPGREAQFPLWLEALGSESAYGFDIQFDPAVLGGRDDLFFQRDFRGRWPFKRSQMKVIFSFFSLGPRRSDEDEAMTRMWDGQDPDNTFAHITQEIHRTLKDTGLFIDITDMRNSTFDDALQRYVQQARWFFQRQWVKNGAWLVTYRSRSPLEIVFKKIANEIKSSKVVATPKKRVRVDADTLVKQARGLTLDVTWEPAFLGEMKARRSEILELASVVESQGYAPTREYRNLQEKVKLFAFLSKEKRSLATPGIESPVMTPTISRSESPDIVPAPNPVKTSNLTIVYGTQKEVVVDIELAPREGFYWVRVKLPSSVDKLVKFKSSQYTLAKDLKEKIESLQGFSSDPDSDPRGFSVELFWKLNELSGARLASDDHRRVLSMARNPVFHDLAVKALSATDPQQKARLTRDLILLSPEIRDAIDSERLKMRSFQPDLELRLHNEAGGLFKISMPRGKVVVVDELQRTFQYGLNPLQVDSEMDPEKFFNQELALIGKRKTELARSVLMRWMGADPSRDHQYENNLFVYERNIMFLYNTSKKVLIIRAGSDLNGQTVSHINLKLSENVLWSNVKSILHGPNKFLDYERRHLGSSTHALFDLHFHPRTGLREGLEMSNSDRRYFYTLPWMASAIANLSGDLMVYVPSQLRASFGAPRDGRDFSVAGLTRQDIKKIPQKIDLEPGTQLNGLNFFYFITNEELSMKECARFRNILAQRRVLALVLNMGERNAMLPRHTNNAFIHLSARPGNDVQVIKDGWSIKADISSGAFQQILDSPSKIEPVLKKIDTLREQSLEREHFGRLIHLLHVNQWLEWSGDLKDVHGWSKQHFLSEKRRVSAIVHRIAEPASNEVFKTRLKNLLGLSGDTFSQHQSWLDIADYLDVLRMPFDREWFLKTTQLDHYLALRDYLANKFSLSSEDKSIQYYPHLGHYRALIYRDSSGYIHGVAMTNTLLEDNHKLLWKPTHKGRAIDFKMKGENLSVRIHDSSEKSVVVDGLMIRRRGSAYEWSTRFMKHDQRRGYWNAVPGWKASRSHSRFGARLAEEKDRGGEPTRLIRKTLLENKSPQRVLRFLVRVTSEQNGRVGEIAIGSQKYTTRYSGKSLVITGVRERGDIRLNPTRYRNHLSRTGLPSHIELDLSSADFKLLYDQSNRAVDAVQFTHIDERKEALVEIDLDAIAVDRQWFSAIGLPLLIQEMRWAARSPWGVSGKYLFVGSPNLRQMVADKISKTSGAQEVLGQAVFYDEKNIERTLLQRKARLTTPRTASLQNGQRYIFMQTPQEGDIPNYRAQLRGAFAWSRVGGEMALSNPSVGELIEYFRKVGITINKIDGGKDFFLVITGQTPNEDIIQRYAMPPIARYSAAKAIQAARLAVAMTSQSA